jgi:chromate reductase, NAD(P)H dehydrogenase (quinone)
MMITVVSGTNRIGSNTAKVSKEYQRILLEKGIETTYFSLEDNNVFSRDTVFEKIETDIIKPTTAFIFIIPEYNGSFPGVLKMLIDTSASHGIWFNKKALLVGNSTGRAGNLRGLDHFSDILNHIKITVHPNKLPLSSVDKLMDENGKFADANTLKAISQQVDEFLTWL